MTKLLVSAEATPDTIIGSARAVDQSRARRFRQERSDRLPRARIWNILSSQASLSSDFYPRGASLNSFIDLNSASYFADAALSRYPIDRQRQCLKKSVCFIF